MKNEIIDDLRQSIEEIKSRSDANSNNNELELNDNAKRCYKRILVLVGYRERCSEELRKRLVDRENFDDGDFSLAIQKAQRVGIVDDQRYAEMYAFTKIQASRGIAGVIRHFDQNKINYLQMPKVVSLIDEYNDSEHFRALEYLKRNPSRSKDQ